MRVESDVGRRQRGCCGDCGSSGICRGGDGAGDGESGDLGLSMSIVSGMTWLQRAYSADLHVGCECEKIESSKCISNSRAGSWKDVGLTGGMLAGQWKGESFIYLRLS